MDIQINYNRCDECREELNRENLKQGETLCDDCSGLNHIRIIEKGNRWQHD